MSIIRHLRKKGKDFPQPLPLYPLDAEKIPGGTESPEAIPLLHHGGGDPVGDAGQFRDLQKGSLIDIYPFSKEVFLADREGAASRAFGGKDGRSVDFGGR
jgi:hypothetical protein